MSEGAVKEEAISTPVEDNDTPSSWVLSALGAPKPSETRVDEEVHPPELEAPSSWVLSALGAPEPSETRVDEEESVPEKSDGAPRKKYNKKKKKKRATTKEEDVHTSRGPIKTTMFTHDLDQEEQDWLDEKDGKKDDDDAPETTIGMLSYM
jgi:hypothetical protein